MSRANFLPPDRTGGSFTPVLLRTPDALVLFDTVTRKTVPIGFGVMSADEVMERIFMLTNSKPGGDF